MYRTHKGNFIVVYAANNLGKSKQMDLLEELWTELERPCVRLKYPIYESESGQLINQVLREGLLMSDRELQQFYAINRREFQPRLEWYLGQGIDVLAEDYVGTGLAWGLTLGVSRQDLDNFNKDLRAPDVSILLDGERFTTGIEKQHRFEQSDQWEINRGIHLHLAKELDWQIVAANQAPSEVHRQVVQKIFGVK